MESIPTNEPNDVKSDETTTKSSKRSSFIDNIQDIKETINGQDFQQKTSSYIVFTLEMYRVLMGTLLLLFVPQKCGDDLCSMSQILSQNDAKYIGNISVNIMTFLAFF